MPTKKEEAVIKEAIADLIPQRKHSPKCYTTFITGSSHEFCECKCHKEKEGSPDPSKKKKQKKRSAL